MKYAVITFIFGKNKELLRKPLFKENIEYICVTDQKDLKSSDWKIIIDEMPNIKCVRDKMVYVKYNPFKYTDADYACVIDGTLEIKSSLLPLFEQLNDHDILVKPIPTKHSIYTALQEWIRTRNMPSNAIQKFQVMAKHDKIDIYKNYLIESCVLVYKNSSKTQELFNKELDYMKFLGENGNLFLSNQCVLTYIIQNEDFNIGYINQKLYFNRYWHNSKRVRLNNV